MDAQQQIEIFTWGFRACLGVMILGYGFAIFAFFKYKIPTIFALMTGRVQKKTIEKMRESGQLRTADELEEDAAMAGGNQSTYADEDEFNTEPISAMPVMGQPYQQTTMLRPEMETTMLRPESETTMLAPEPETTMLASEAETTMLSPSEAETTMLSAEAETSVLKSESQNTADNFEIDGEAETSVLSQADLNAPMGGATAELSQASMPDYMKEEQARRAKFRFEIIENTLITHTDEKI